jgi:hypothetical protein
MSEVTDIRCAVSKGDLAGGTSSTGASVASTSPTSAPLGCSASPLVSAVATAATASGTGESALGSWTVVSVDARLLMSDRDRDCERSVCDSGRGVISEASSKLSCNGARSSVGALGRLLACCAESRGPLTPSLSELCELVGLSGFLSSSMLPGLGCSWCLSKPDIRSNKSSGDAGRPNGQCVV